MFALCTDLINSQQFCFFFLTPKPIIYRQNRKREVGRGSRLHLRLSQSGLQGRSGSLGVVVELESFVDGLHPRPRVLPTLPELILLLLGHGLDQHLHTHTQHTDTTHARCRVYSTFLALRRLLSTLTPSQIDSFDSFKNLPNNKYQVYSDSEPAKGVLDVPGTNCGYKSITIT